jgi:hypothetical protein
MLFMNNNEDGLGFENLTIQSASEKCVLTRSAR